VSTTTNEVDADEKEARKTEEQAMRLPGYRKVWPRRARARFCG
jgi:hypothetical protein